MDQRAVSVRLFVFYLSHGLVQVCEIELSHMGKNNGNPDLVTCARKKIPSQLNGAKVPFPKLKKNPYSSNELNCDERNLQQTKHNLLSLSTKSCAYPESFVRGGPSFNFFLFFRGERESKRILL